MKLTDFGIAIQTGKTKAGSNWHVISASNIDGNALVVAGGGRHGHALLDGAGGYTGHPSAVDDQTSRMPGTHTDEFSDPCVRHLEPRLHGDRVADREAPVSACMDA